MELQNQNRIANEKLSDAELLRLYLDERSEAAFATIGKRYARLIYSVCLREMGTPCLAEDASQEALLLLSRKAAALRGRNDLAGWLFLAARYTCKNMLKQERRTRLLEEKAATDRIGQETLNASGFRISENSIWDEIEPHFNDVLARLKPADRQAVLLRFVQEESLKEVGIRLGISENTARMRINRAIDRIRVFLERAGVVVSTGVLVAILAERSSASTNDLSSSIAKIASEAVKQRQAGGSLQLSKISQKTWMQMTRKKFFLSLSLGATGFLFFFGGFALIKNAKESVGRAERKQLFANLSGHWQGGLEYADDRTGQHFTYPSNLKIEGVALAENLRMAATFEGSTAEDITVLSRDDATGGLIAENQGDNRSHALRSVGDLIREGDDRFVFYGYDVGRNVETRILIDYKPSQLSIQEEYRTPYWALASVLAPISRHAFPGVSAFKGSPSEYKFRNRFKLTRK